MAAVENWFWKTRGPSRGCGSEELQRKREPPKWQPFTRQAWKHLLTLKKDSGYRHIFSSRDRGAGRGIIPNVPLSQAGEVLKKGAVLGPADSLTLNSTLQLMLQHARNLYKPAEASLIQF